MTRARDAQRQKLYDAEGVAHFDAYSLAKCQKMVDKILGHRMVRARWGDKKMTVKGGRGCHYNYGRITLAPWGRNLDVIIHEVAHGLTGEGDGLYPAHGPQFAGVVLFLREVFIGPENAAALRQRFREGGVHWNKQAIPEPQKRTPKHEIAARKIAQSRAPLEPRAVRLVIDNLRQAARAGQFGPAGSRPRNDALATALRLEKGLHGAKP